MTPIKLSGASVDASLSGFASGVSGAAFTLTANDSNDSLAHLVAVRNNAATDHSGKTLALVGTGPNGEPQTETLTGPAGNATVTSTKYWLTLTSITPSATIGVDTFEIGWAAACVSPWFYLDRVARWGADSPNGLGFGCIVDSGSPTYTVQHTYDGGATAFNHSTVASKTAAAEGSYSAPVQAVRLSFAAFGGVSLHGYM